MKKIISVRSSGLAVIFFAMMFAWVSQNLLWAAVKYGSETTTETKPDVKIDTKTLAKPVQSPPVVPEAMKKFEAVQNQELWVAKLQKQLDGEISQLNEMRSSLAQSFGLDVKKLEKGEYYFDAKSGKLVEK